MAVKSDYRRVFIMLRPLGVENGSGGFCRIETRAGKGQIVFSTHIDVADGELRALLVAGDAIADCGALRSVRGQGVLACDIDRDAYDRRPIDAYDAAVIVYLYGDSPSIALIGALENGRPDIRRIERMLEARYGKREALRVASLPVADAGIYRKEEAPPPVIAERAAYQAASPALAEDYPTFSEETPDESLSLHQYDQPVADGEWVGICADIRDQYERGPAVRPFADMDDVRFRRMPMATEQYGIDYYILGVRYKHARPEALCYGVPGSYRAYPPPGLEGYRWRAANDGQPGYWLSWLDAVTGDPV